MHRYPIWHIKHEGSYESIPDIYLSNRNLTSHQIDNSADHLHDPALMLKKREHEQHLARRWRENGVHTFSFRGIQ